MQAIVLPLAIALLGADDAPPSPFPMPHDAPLAAGRELRPDFLAGNKCRDSNLPTADNPGSQPRFERGPATPDMGQMIYAVDRRIDGCSVVLAVSARSGAFSQLTLSPEEKAELLGRR
jgi:hypothetical protein